MFICRGAGETLGDWIGVQRLLHAQGVASFVGMARALAAAASAPTRLVVHRGYDHNALRSTPALAQWAPIVAVARDGALPPATDDAGTVRSPR